VLAICIFFSRVFLPPFNKPDDENRRRETQKDYADAKLNDVTPKDAVTSEGLKHEQSSTQADKDRSSNEE
jgi:hypothetical protein